MHHPRMAVRLYSASVRGEPLRISAVSTTEIPRLSLPAVARGEVSPVPSLAHFGRATNRPGCCGPSSARHSVRLSEHSRRCGLTYGLEPRLCVGGHTLLVEVRDELIRELGPNGEEPLPGRRGDAHVARGEVGGKGDKLWEGRRTQERARGSRRSTRQQAQARAPLPGFVPPITFSTPYYRRPPTDEPRPRLKINEKARAWFRNDI